MRRLCVYEMKKLFYKRSSIIVLCLLMIAPLTCCLLLQSHKDGNTALYKGEMIYGAQVRNVADALREQMRGEVDATWIKEREQQLMLLKQHQINEDDIRFTTINKAYLDGKAAMSVRKTLLQDRTLPNLIRHDVKRTVFQYGPYEGWLIHMRVFCMLSILYLLGCMYLFSDLFNQEDACEISDVLKSSKYGRQQLVHAKLWCALFITSIVGIAMYALFILSSTMLLNLSESNTTLMMLNVFQIFNFKEINQQAFILFMIGGLATTLMVSFASTLCRKPMISLAVGAGIVILPYLFIGLINLSFDVTLLIPSMFTKFDGKSQLMEAPWASLHEQLVFHRAPLISVLWLILAVLFYYLIYKGHCRQRKN